MLSLNCEQIRKLARKFSRLFHSHKILLSALLGLLQTKMTQISLPSHILQPHLKPGKGTHFAILPELPRIGHCRGVPPPRIYACFLVVFFILDLDECKDKTHQCDVNANCTNIPGLYNLRSGSIFVSL